MFSEKNIDQFKYHTIEFNNEEHLLKYAVMSNKNKELLPLTITAFDKKLVTEKLNNPLLIYRNFGPLEFMNVIFEIYKKIEKIHSDNPFIRAIFPSLNRIHDDGRVQYLQFTQIDVSDKKRFQKYTLMKSLKNKIIDKVFPNFTKRINIDNFYNEPIEKLKEFMAPLFLASYEDRKLSPDIVVMDIDVVKEGCFNKLEFFSCNCISRSVKLAKSDLLYYVFGEIGENETRCYPVFQNNMKFISGDHVKTII